MAYATAVIMGLNFASNFLKSEQERQYYEAQADIELQNAEILRKNAYMTRAIGSRNEDVSRAQNRAYLAGNMAIAGEAGIGESPTLLSAISSSAMALEQNVLNDRYKVESQAENYLYQARVAEENARQLKQKSDNSFASSMLSSVSGFF
ncbi:MAG: hypothetical protein IJZ30_00845 [Alphaproteobacteria bacterium]|nr:hypothetical protein [Alphaproteobacteria bacterium]